MGAWWLALAGCCAGVLLSACPPESKIVPAAGLPVQPEKVRREDFLCANGQRVLVLLDVKQQKLSLDVGNGVSAELPEVAPDTDQYSNGQITFTRHQQFAVLIANGIVTECRLTVPKKSKP